jgi:hypothetical protein
LGERTHDTIVVILQEAAIAADCWLALRTVAFEGTVTVLPTRVVHRGRIGVTFVCPTRAINLNQLSTERDWFTSDGNLISSAKYRAVQKFVSSALSHSVVRAYYNEWLYSTDKLLFSNFSFEGFRCPDHVRAGPLFKDVYESLYV